jgi:hypothetical protein
MGYGEANTAEDIQMLSHSRSFLPAKLVLRNVQQGQE